MAASLLRPGKVFVAGHFCFLLSSLGFPLSFSFGSLGFHPMATLISGQD
jgi:hypothetical protein